MLKRAVILTLVFCPVLPALPAGATDFSLMPTIAPLTITNFPLTETLLNKIEQVQEALLQLPNEADDTENNNNNTIEGLTSALEKKPKLMAILKKNAISPRSYVMGYMALSAALAAASSENEEQIIDESRAVSKENLAFGKKYANRIRRLLDR